MVSTNASEVIGPTPGCVISNRACSLPSAARLRRLIQLADLDIEHRPQPLQILSPARRPAFQR